MKVIAALGGGGSTFVLRALERCNYQPLFNQFDPFAFKLRLERRPFLIAPYHLLLRAAGAYRPTLLVLKRPDSFWTDWQAHPGGIYDPRSGAFAKHVRGQRDYIVNTRWARSVGLRIPRAALSVASLPTLVRSYLRQLKRIERESDFTIALVAGHWAEYGIFKQLQVETVYVIRDPFNSLISHSKAVRHRKDYRRRGLRDINTQAWIDAYLSGPHHYWIDFARTALEHGNATIVRYHRFAEDWQKVEGLPNIAAEFTYQENDVAGILSPESITYIHAKTREVCKKLGFDTVCAKYLRR